MLGDIYAITTQNKKYNDIDYRTVLGITEFIHNKKKDSILKFLETNPKYANNKQGNFTGIGTSFIKFFKSFNKPFRVKSSYPAANFYEKKGLELLNPRELLYRWVPLKRRQENI